LVIAAVVRRGVMRFSMVLSFLTLFVLEARGQCGWEALGEGTNGPVYAIAVLPNGDIVAGGGFTSAGGVAANRIARWNGSQWLPMGAGFNGEVKALAVMSNGDLIAGGEFWWLPGNAQASAIAIWNGSSWSELGGGMSGNGRCVWALAAMPNGDLIAGGTFSRAGGVPASNIARWDGANWSAIGSGTDGTVYAIEPLDNGDLVAGGAFSNSGLVQTNNVARWNGSSWLALGAGVNSVVSSLAETSSGELFAGGYFVSAGGIAVNNIAKWNGISWSSPGSGMGQFGNNPDVLALAALADDTVIAGGRFTTAGGTDANKIARWNGSVWAGLGGGMAASIGAPPDVFSIKVLANGDLVAGGYFNGVGGTTASHIAIARWGDLGQVVQDPDDIRLIPLSTANFSTSAVGVGIVSYRWRRNGIDLLNGVRITGIDTSDLSIASVTASDQGMYDCRITNACGTFYSRSASLSCAPIITQQPVTFQHLSAGMQLVLQVPAGASYSYRWRQNGQNLFNIPGLFSGVTSRTLTIQGQDSSLAGVYDCVLTNSCGTVISNASHVPCLADFNLDGAVDSDDVITYFAQWDSSDANADVNRDGGVDGDDIVVFFGRWDGGC
jgi:hypothetical protein